MFVSFFKNVSHYCFMRWGQKSRKCIAFFALRPPNQFSVQYVFHYIHTFKDFSSISDRNFHQLWLSVQVKKSKSIVLCVAYRPDDTPLSFFEDTLKLVYTQALLLNKPIIILGDLNCDGLDSSCREYAAINSFTREMNLQQLIKEPTRITATTESLLDVILVSDPSSVRKSGVINNPISDHLPVYVVLKLKSPKISPHYVAVRSYKN